MGDCDYSYGSAVSSLSSVGHEEYDQFSHTSRPSIQPSIDPSIQSSVDRLDPNCSQYYVNCVDSSCEPWSQSQTTPQTQTQANGLPLESSQSSTDDCVSDHNSSAIRAQNEEFIASDNTEDITQSYHSPQTNSINRVDNTCAEPKMQNIDEFTRRLSKSSQSVPKTETESNDKSIEGQIKASVNGSNGTTGAGNSANGVSGSDNTHLNPNPNLNSDSSPVISSANNSEQQFWSTNCGTDSDVSQQPFLSSNTSANALNGGLQYPQYSSNMNNSFGANSALTPGLSNLSQSQHSSVSSAQRRAITGAHNFPQNSLTATRPQGQSQTSSLFKTYTSGANWTAQSAQPSAASWSTAASQSSTNSVNPWGSINVNAGKRGVTAVPNLSPISPMKKSPPTLSQTPSMMISPSKYRRSSSMPMGKPFPNNMAAGNTPFDLVSTGSDTTSSSSESTNVREANIGLPFQERQMGSATSPLDTLRFPLEQQLLEIIRTSGDSQDQYKGYVNYNHTGLQSLSQIQGPSFTSFDDFSGNKKYFRGKSPFFTGLDSDNHILMDSNSAAAGDSGERFSRKVFVGGLPPDIDEEEITASFRRFGPLVVDWPHKAESKSYFPPKGYAFLLFQDESSVQALIDACIQEDDKLYLCVSSPTIKDKPVQIRPWRLSDADFVLDASMPLDPRKTVFVGGVPRPLKAVELAMIMDRLYGGVCYAGIDTDPELRYPKGAGRVAFSNQQSYIAAISARFVQLQHGDIEKRVEVKPYVLDDQICDECQGARCGGKFAPFFCANVTCLQYYCEHCWATIHSRPGREFHKPLVKEGADRPRAVPFRWC